MKPYKYQPTSRRDLIASQHTSKNGLVEITETHIIEIPDNSLLSKQFEKNHYHLYHWLNTGLGRKYLEQQSVVTS